MWNINGKFWYFVVRFDIYKVGGWSNLTDLMCNCQPVKVYIVIVFILLAMQTSESAGNWF